MAKIVPCAIGVALALIGIGYAQASEPGLHAWCSTLTQVEEEKVQCQVRSRDGSDLLDARVTSASGRELPAMWDRYSSTKYTSAWYFLIQQSNVSPTQLDKMSKAVRNLLSFKDNHIFAVATYTDTLEQRAEFSPYAGQIDKVLLDIQVAKPSSRPPAFYKSARAATYQLANINADRKSLVLLSDGTNEDVTVSEKEVIEFARKNAIIIYALFFGNKNGRPENLSRLADRTNGLMRDFSNDSAGNFSLFASSFSQLLENGFVLTLNARDISEYDELKISGRFRDKNLVANAPPVPVHGSTRDIISDRLRRFVLDNSLILIALLVVLVGLLLIVDSWRRKKQVEYSVAVPGRTQTAQNYCDRPKELQKSKSDVSEIPNPESADNSHGAVDLAHQIYGWLEFLDAESTRIPISAAALRIGRHEDNDLCFPNKSVHRHHALLHRTSAGDFIIRDLGTKNGVIINGKRCAERRLEPNDLIELGEVRLRFLFNKEPGHSPRA